LSLPVFFTSVARLEVAEAQDWYEAKARGLGAVFRSGVDRQVERMAANPLQFPRVLRDVRRAKRRQFPYGLFGRALPEGLFVVACFHSSRDPLAWHRRF